MSAHVLLNLFNELGLLALKCMRIYQLLVLFVSLHLTRYIGQDGISCHKPSKSSVVVLP